MMDTGATCRPGQGAMYNNSDYGINEHGERIVLGTRRADGTYRKERKVRAGYVPPDEQVAYISRGKQWRLEAEKEPVPGFEGEIILPTDSSPSKPMSKAAKKNAARKAKKAAEGDHCTTGTEPAAPEAVQQQTTPAAHAGANELDNELEAKDKRIRALKKKIRQCEQLEEKVSSGAELTPEQREKLGGMQALQKELEALSVS